MTEFSDENTDVLDDLFHLALQQPVDQRGAWLKQRCGEDRVLYEELSSLLQAHEQSGDFLEGQVCLPEPDGPDLSGQQVGVYRIDSLIARGGMGQVYRAHRCDGSYEQIVAIKVVDRGHIQNQLFQAERQILADLNHPAITTILDGGLMPESEYPYLVMEYIDGIQITDYVQSQSLSCKARVVLFLSLLDAVSLAHQRGVIHCDLKPANIFVDQRGDLKLLDFGVAHAVARSRDDEPGRAECYGLTAGYSSPQRLAGAKPVIADDIYSLGVVFALIMTETDPGQYKTTLSSGLRRLANSLSPEARSIFEKAANDFPEQRYASTAEFADELRGWLAGRPISAMHGKRLYQFGKHLQRHRLAWLSGALFVAVLLAGMQAWWQNDRADRAQVLAELQRDMATQLAKSVIQDLDNKVVLLEGSTLVRLNNAREALARLEEIHRAEPQNLKIQSALADAHLQIGGLMANPFQLHIGQFEEGREHIRQAYDLYLNIYAQAPDTASLMALVRGERFIAAQLVYVEGKVADGLKLEADRLARFKDIEQTLSPGAKSILGVKYVVISHILIQMEKLTEAAVGYERAARLVMEPDAAQSEFIQERMRKTYDFFAAEKALFSLVKGDLAEAESGAQQIIQRNAGRKYWRYQHTASQANQILACVALLDRQDTQSAAKYLFEARGIVQNLSDAFPAAVSLQWALQRFAGLDDMQNTDQPGSLQAWIDQFSCARPQSIAQPAAPPGGWLPLRQQLSFSFLDVIKP